MRELTHVDAYMCKEESGFACNHLWYWETLISEQLSEYGPSNWLSSISEILKVELNIEFLDNLVFLISQSK